MSSGKTAGASASWARTWLAEYGRSTFLYWDFLAGMATGCVIGGAAWNSSKITAGAGGLFTGSFALGIAVLSAVLGALAIVSSLINDSYLRVLEHAGGISAAIMPFQTLAVVSGLCSIAGGLAMALQPVMGNRQTAVALGLAAALTLWSLLGMVSLVNHVAFHARERGRLLEGIEEAKRAALQRRHAADEPEAAARARLRRDRPSRRPAE